MTIDPVPAAKPLVFRSAQMRATIALALRAGERDSKVLITGESGVGKDVVARYIHGASARKDVLGDVGRNDPAQWEFGTDPEQAHVFFAVYGRTPANRPPYQASHR